MTNTKVTYGYPNVNTEESNWETIASVVLKGRPYDGSDLPSEREARLFEAHYESKFVPSQVGLRGHEISPNILGTPLAESLSLPIFHSLIRLELTEDDPTENIAITASEFIKALNGFDIGYGTRSRPQGEERKKRLDVLKAEILSVLRDVDINDVVVVEFQGGGDEGDVTDIHFEDVTQTVEKDKRLDLIDAKVCAWFDRFSEDAIGLNWFDGTGGHGTMTINPQTEKIIFTVYQREEVDVDVEHGVV